MKLEWIAHFWPLVLREEILLHVTSTISMGHSHIPTLWFSCSQSVLVSLTMTDLHELVANMKHETEQLHYLLWWFSFYTILELELNLLITDLCAISKMKLFSFIFYVRIQFMKIS